MAANATAIASLANIASETTRDLSFITLFNEFQKDRSKVPGVIHAHPTPHRVPISFVEGSLEVKLATSGNLQQVSPTDQQREDQKKERQRREEKRREEKRREESEERRSKCAKCWGRMAF